MTLLIFFTFVVLVLTIIDGRKKVDHLKLGTWLLTLIFTVSLKLSNQVPISVEIILLNALLVLRVWSELYFFKNEITTKHHTALILAFFVLLYPFNLLGCLLILVALSNLLASEDSTNTKLYLLVQLFLFYFYYSFKALLPFNFSLLILPLPFVFRLKDAQDFYLISVIYLFAGNTVSVAFYVVFITFNFLHNLYLLKGFNNKHVEKLLILNKLYFQKRPKLTASSKGNFRFMSYNKIKNLFVLPDQFEIIIFAFLICTFIVIGTL